MFIYCKPWFDHYVSSVSIGSTRKFGIGMKIVYSIPIEKLVRVWNGVDLQDVNNIITQFFVCFILFKCTHLTDNLSAEHSQHLYTRQQIYTKVYS